MGDVTRHFDAVCPVLGNGFHRPKAANPVMVLYAGTVPLRDAPVDFPIRPGEFRARSNIPHDRTGTAGNRLRFNVELAYTAPPLPKSSPPALTRRTHGHDHPASEHNSPKALVFPFVVPGACSQHSALQPGKAGPRCERFAGVLTPTDNRGRS